jgi:ABC-type uncharacterized transport system substrate-binding protein
MAATELRVDGVERQADEERRAAARVGLERERAAVLLDDHGPKGVPVSRLPIERPAFHHLILNLDTARQIGVRFSPEVLNRADELVGSTSAR